MSHIVYIRTIVSFFFFFLVLACFISFKKNQTKKKNLKKIQCPTNLESNLCRFQINSPSNLCRIHINSGARLPEVLDNPRVRLSPVSNNPRVRLFPVPYKVRFKLSSGLDTLQVRISPRSKYIPFSKITLSQV